MNVHDFIETNIDHYSPSDLPDEVKTICKRLNDILNRPCTSINYFEWLMKKENDDEIMNLVSDLFECMQPNLFLSLEDLFNMLRTYQENNKIKSKRDHYHHSIQCLLLGLSVYPFLKGKYPHNDSNFLANIFSMCIYHDLGYLYHLTEDFDNGEKTSISMAILNFFYDYKNAETNYDNLHKMLCISDTLTDKAISYSSSEQNSIWISFNMTNDKRDLEGKCSCKFIQGPTANHAFESAVILNRLINLKEDCCSNNLVSAAPNSIIPTMQQNSIKGYAEFLEVLKAVVFHNYKIQGLINFQENFWPCFLMLVDEMQTYGRPFKNSDLNYKLINPLHVDFDTDSGKIKMEINACGNSYISSSQANSKEDIQSEYNKHSGKTVKDALKEKIETTFLDGVLES